MSSIPGSGRSPGEGHGENPTDRGAWWNRVPKVAKSRMQLKQFSTHILLRVLKIVFHVCAKSLHLVSNSLRPHQTPLSMGFSRQEYWSGLPCPPPGDLPDPGIELMSFTSPALAGAFCTTSATWDKSIHFLLLHLDWKQNNYLYFQYISL